jgi:hypothetical protein
MNLLKKRWQLLRLHFLDCTADRRWAGITVSAATKAKDRFYTLPAGKENLSPAYLIAMEPKEVASDQWPERAAEFGWI